MQKLLLPVTILVFFLTMAIFVTTIENTPYSGIPTSTSFPLQLKNKIPKMQRIQDAFQLEFEKTKDPATNTIPKERLFEAKRIADIKLESIAERTAIAGINWEERGPSNVGGRTRAIMIDLNNSNTVWAGSVSGGLWKSTDAGDNWTKINDFFGNLAITAIAQDPSKQDTMYFSTGEGFGNFDSVVGMGLWKSTNGGNSWSHLDATNGSAFWYCNNIKIASNGTVFVATNYGGVQKSTDAGTNWTSVFSGRINDIDIAANGDIYAAKRSDGIYKSTDSGDNWTKLTTGLPADGFRRIELACAPSNSNVVYALYQDADNTAKGIYKTTDGGAHWSTMTMATDHDGNNFASHQAWYDLIVAVDPNDSDRVFIGGLDLYASKDGASSWEQISQWHGGDGEQYVHADQHAIVFVPGSSDIVYFGNDGGIFKTTNGTATTPDIAKSDDDYNVTQYYACAMDPAANSNLFYAGSQDNGTQQYEDSGINQTNKVTGGDGGFCHIGQTNSDIRITAYVFNSYWVTADAGAHLQRIEFGSSSGKFINPTDYDDNANILYCSYDSGKYGFIKDVGNTNTTGSQALENLDKCEISAVQISPSVNNRVFFGTDDGRIIKVDNAHTTSPTDTPLFTHPDSAYVSCIAVAPGTNDQHLLVTFSNYGVTSIYESTDSGNNWAAVEGDLPDMPVRWVIFHPNDDDKALIATELGVWSTDNLNGGSTDWDPTNDGLANVRTDMIQYRTSDNLMIAATHGRGLYSSSSIPLPVELVSFDGKATKTGNQLFWETASEEQNDYFRIQRSTDGKSFENIGKLTGKGNSTQTNNYTFWDDSPTNDINYYRLQQVDLDGTENNSKIIAIKTETASELTIAPNPIQGNTLRFAFDSDRNTNGTISIFDLTGKRVHTAKKSFSKGTNRENIALDKLPAGIYSLIIQQGEQVLQTKFVVE